jgi:MYXO-CTERM domain-containing protein
MDPSIIRIACAALAAVLLGVIVLRRRRTKAE